MATEGRGSRRCGFRFGLRSMIALVGVAALALGFEMTRRRRAECLRRSFAHRCWLIRWNGGHMYNAVMSPEDEADFARRSPHACWHLANPEGDRPSPVSASLFSG